MIASCCRMRSASGPHCIRSFSEPGDLDHAILRRSVTDMVSPRYRVCVRVKHVSRLRIVVGRAWLWNDGMMFSLMKIKPEHVNTKRHGRAPGGCRAPT